MKKGLKFTKEQLEKLYTADKLALIEIGNRFGCDSTNILYWLKKFNIPRRPAYLKKIHIPKEVLNDLYWNKGLKPREIAQKFGIKNERTVRKKLEKYGIKRKTVSEALTIKFKAPFSSDPAEKAYLLGLRAGDFHAKWARKSVRIQTTTTHQAQVELLGKSFEKYGEIRKYLSKNKARASEWFIYVDLHPSFSFLLDKPEKIPSWVTSNDTYFYNFLAAYTDCELNWNITKSHKNLWRACFRLRTGDRNILEQIKARLTTEGLCPLMSLKTKQGTPSGFGHYNVDMHEIVLNRKADIYYIIHRTLPLSRHSEKVRQMMLILESKHKSWEVFEPKLKKLRQEIKKEILKD
ncbi:MAG: hypothetical protein KKD17_03775 [Nanoarchaeota archaeon]|nr:hypothetical protein [Nanoarchaeota archaeon]